MWLDGFNFGNTQQEFYKACHNAVFFVGAMRNDNWLGLGKKKKMNQLPNSSILFSPWASLILK